jgi:hypothetical protein
VQIFTYQQLLTDLEAALEWLRNVGIRYEATRFARYRKSLRKVVHAIEAGEQPDPQSLIVAGYESEDLVQIHQCLSANVHERLRDKLERFVSGPASYVDENPDTSSNAARNFGLELMVSARLTAARMALNFHTAADAAAIVDGRVVMFECKRPHTLDSVEGNFGDAAKQLRAIYDAERVDCCGAVVLDITNALNKEFKIPLFRDERHLSTWLLKVSESFMAERRAVWHSRCEQTQTTAVWGRFALMAATQEPRRYVRAECCPIVPLSDEGTTNRHTCDVLAMAFRPLDSRFRS